MPSVPDDDTIPEFKYASCIFSHTADGTVFLTSEPEVWESLEDFEQMHHASKASVVVLYELKEVERRSCLRDGDTR